MDGIKQFKEFRKITSDINQVLQRNGISSTIGLSDITVTEKTVSDLVKAKPKLSELIINNIWPSISEMEVFHYTSKDAAESILSTKTFRLYSILRRFDEGEIVTFCKNQALTGYLEEDENGEKKYKSLIMPNTFYASFTDTKLPVEQERYFWKTFTQNKGVRLRLIIKSRYKDFRKMNYEETKGKPLDILYDLTNTIKQKYSKEFILTGISRLCSFYLAKDFDEENEFRILYRYWNGSNLLPKNDGNHEYIEIPLGEKNASGYYIEVKGIQTNEILNIPSTYLVLKRNS